VLLVLDCSINDQSVVTKRPSILAQSFLNNLTAANGADAPIWPLVVNHWPLTGSLSRLFEIPPGHSLPYDFLNLYGIFSSRFWSSVSQKRLELKSLKRRTKAEEEGTQFCRENSTRMAEPRVHREETDLLLNNNKKGGRRIC
jgi:hypothetical protein